MAIMENLTEEEIAKMKNEKDYNTGRRSVYSELMRICLRELGHEAYSHSEAKLALERAEAIEALRRACVDYGDNDWEPSLHLADIIEKHLTRHLE